MTSSVEQIFTAACELQGEARAAWLDEACAGDTELRARVEALLAADADAGSFLLPVAPELHDGLSDAGTEKGEEVPREAAGQMVGKYKLLQNIGEGGFGTVWMAEQMEPVRRKVALKIIKLGMDTRQVVARFEAERQALALLDHSNIAKVFDAGSTERGRPYFVMELVRGVPILEYCNSKKLDTRSRLRLFALVCQAIQHAHQKGIIHRDIKPGNILVTLHDGVPVPKVIDFGIAKATDQELTQRTLFTEHHQLMGTPAYMSPEQAEMSGLDIDTRSDIYSLGVLLYELLTGTTPFAHKELMERGFGEMLRIIREETPHKPSTRLSTLGKSGTITAGQRDADVKKLGFILRGDLDWIVMKCLEKDRTRRYDTASGLAEDITRHLSDEPVNAGPPGARYKFRKFVRRHRGRVAAALAILLVLVLGVIGTSSGMVWAMSERDKARAAEFETAQRADELQQVADFQAEQLGEIDPQRMGVALRRALVDGVPDDRRDQIELALAGVNFTSIARGTLDASIFRRTIEAIDSRFAEQPLVRAQLLYSTGRTLLLLGLLDRAEDPQARALTIRRGALGDDHPDTLDSIGTMGTLLKEQGRLDEAEGYYRDALEGTRRVLGDDHPKTLNAVNNMGSFLLARGNLDEAAPYFIAALEGRRRVLGNDHLDTLISMISVGRMRRAQGDLAASEVLTLEALEGTRRVLGDDHPRTLNALNNMGFLKFSRGQLDEAELYLREALERSRRVLGDDHPRTLSSISNLGVLLNRQGTPDEAEPLYREVLERRRRLLGEDHPSTLTSVSNMGSLLQAQGKREEALPFFAAALAGSRRNQGDDHPETLISIRNMGVVLQAQGRLEEAEPYFNEALERRDRVLGERHPLAVESTREYADLLNDLGRFGEASERLRAREGTARAVWADDPGRLGAYLRRLGVAEAGLGHYTASEAVLLEAFGLLEGTYGEGDDRAQRCVERLAALYGAWHAAEPGNGHDAEAERWRARLSDTE